ncbi:MAG TPA: tRNA (adenosine(37)-N6)-threonylcarbamoyltransferase complex ATPase subunit type 1 TsaE [Bacteroidia bacterium]|nr:tRNA (adenosine(37)-N6)-threonylcarbamoyltransferase complex ATPase subunit type 1 TsaE [Bacteroidia bacterium]
MKDQLLIKDINDLPAVAVALLTAFGKEKVIAFHGPMGAGKTTLIKALCMELGVGDNTSSPTYSLVNEYRTNTGERIYHFDFYRIKNEDEARDMGLEEYLDSGSWCFIEWPEKVASLLPLHHQQVIIGVEAGQRCISLRP